MVVEIECFEGDVLLYGPGVSFAGFQKQVRAAERLCDQDEDNFVALLCRLYFWEVLEELPGEPPRPQYVYDRATQKCRRAGQAGR